MSQASRPRTLALPRGQGLSLPRNTTTTAHLASMYPFAAQGGLGVRGVLLGRDRLTGGEGFFWDLFQAHADGLITAPNAIVCGAGGHGKSAIVKTWLWRSSALAGSRRRLVAVIDPKGEWKDIGRRLGYKVVALRPGGTDRVNPLDHGARRAEGAGRPGEGPPTAPLVAALLTVVLSRALTVGEDRAVSHFVGRVQEEHARFGGQATLRDLREAIAAPRPEDGAALDTAVDDLRLRTRDLVDATAKFLDHDLAGMFDGPSTIRIDWDTAPGLVLDLSALLESPLALKLVLIAAAGWLQAAMHRQPGRVKLNIIDEGWMALQELATVRYLQDAWRLGRQFGTGNILITHALTDLRSQADDGTALAKIAEGFLHTTSVKVFLHQNADQVDDLLGRIGLSGPEGRRLPTLGPGEALWKLGAHTALVDHFVADDETFVDTNQAMRTGASAATR